MRSWIVPNRRTYAHDSKSPPSHGAVGERLTSFCIILEGGRYCSKRTLIQIIWLFFINIIFHINNLQEETFKASVTYCIREERHGYCHMIYEGGYWHMIYEGVVFDSRRNACKIISEQGR